MITVRDLKKLLAYLDDDVEVVLLHNEQETDWGVYEIAVGESADGELVISAVHQAACWSEQGVTSLSSVIKQLREEK